MDVCLCPTEFSIPGVECFWRMRSWDQNFVLLVWWWSGTLFVHPMERPRKHFRYCTYGSYDNGMACTSYICVRWWYDMSCTSYICVDWWRRTMVTKPVWYVGTYQHSLVHTWIILFLVCLFLVIYRDISPPWLEQEKDYKPSSCKQCLFMYY